MPPAPKRLLGLHGEQDFRFHRPIEAGMTLRTRAMPIGITPRSTGSLITVRGITETVKGELIVEQFVTVFIRTAIAPEALGEEPPTRDYDAEPEPFAEVVQTFDAIRASATWERPATSCRCTQTTLSRGRPGSPASSCTATVPSRSPRVRCSSTPRATTPPASSAGRPVQPLGDALRHHHDADLRAGSRDGRSIYHFETLLADGTPCLSGGLIEVED